MRKTNEVRYHDCVTGRLNSHISNEKLVIRHGLACAKIIRLRSKPLPITPIAASRVDQHVTLELWTSQLVPQLIASRVKLMAWLLLRRPAHIHESLQQ